MYLTSLVGTERRKRRKNLHRITSQNILHNKYFYSHLCKLGTRIGPSAVGILYISWTYALTKSLLLCVVNSVITIAYADSEILACHTLLNNTL